MYANLVLDDDVLSYNTLSHNDCTDLITIPMWRTPESSILKNNHSKLFEEMVYPSTIPRRKDALKEMFKHYMTIKDNDWFLDDVLDDNCSSNVELIYSIPEPKENQPYIIANFPDEKTVKKYSERRKKFYGITPNRMVVIWSNHEVKNRLYSAQNSNGVLYYGCLAGVTIGESLNSTLSMDIIRLCFGIYTTNQLDKKYDSLDAVLAANGLGTSKD
jgi:hypothetical protein